MKTNIKPLGMTLVLILGSHVHGNETDSRGSTVENEVVIIWTGPVGAVAIFSQSTAGAGCGCDGDGHVSTNLVSGSSSTSADCSDDFNGDGTVDTADAGFMICARAAVSATARTWDPVVGQPIVRLWSSVIGFGGASTNGVIIIDVSNSWSATASNEIGAQSTTHGVVERKAADFGDGWQGVYYADCGQASASYIYNAVTNSWQRSVSMAGPAGIVELASQQASFSDIDFDVNADNRFNGDDVVALLLLVGSVDPAELLLFDFDSDGIIGQPDVDYIEQFVDAGLDSGIFGDADSDGLVKCADLQMLRSLIGLTLCDSGYLIALDNDLDGDIDSSDESALEAILLPLVGDLNGDLRVDTSDLGVLIGQFGTSGPSGDLNMDGIVDTADLGLLVSMFGEECS
jgi:hypothetical protein